MSIFFMGVTALISIGLPVFAFIYWRKKFNLKAVPLLCGIAFFLLFAYVLQSIMHGFVLERNEDGSVKLITENPWLYVIYAILAAGIFEETGRFIAFKLMRKKHNDLGTGLAYGIGHGGIESIFLVGLIMIGNILVCLMINSGDTASLSDANLPGVVAVMQSTPSITFLAGGIERIIAMTVHISLSVVVLCSVIRPGMMWLYPLAIALHAIVNIAPAMMQAGFIKNIWVVEAVILIPVALCVYVAIKVCKIITDQNAMIEDKQTANSVSEPTGPTL